MTQKCDKRICGKDATWVVISGCLKYMHVNVKYRCDEHAQMVRDIFARDKLVCWECRAEKRQVPHHSDDMIMRNIWREVAA